LSSSCQLGLGVILRHFSLSSYTQVVLRLEKISELVVIGLTKKIKTNVEYIRAILDSRLEVTPEN